MSVLTSGPHAWLGKQFGAWRQAHGWQPGMVWDPRGGDGAKCGYCGKPRHGAYVWPGRST
jgi:hypothetical protein